MPCAHFQCLCQLEYGCLLQFRSIRPEGAPAGAFYDGSREERRFYFYQNTKLLLALLKVQGVASFEWNTMIFSFPKTKAGQYFQEINKIAK